MGELAERQPEHLRVRRLEARQECRQLAHQ
jgi:hypothetical protein